MATKELAQRLSGGDGILLLWHPESGRIEVSVRDPETGDGFEIEVAGGRCSRHLPASLRVRGPSGIDAGPSES